MEGTFIENINRENYNDSFIIKGMTRDQINP